MNLSELPISLMTERAPKGCKTLIFEGQEGRLIITGSDLYGLPTAPDADVIVGLIQLTKMRNGFTDPTVSFTRYELLKFLDGRTGASTTGGSTSRSTAGWASR